MADATTALRTVDRLGASVSPPTGSPDVGRSSSNMPYLSPEKRGPNAQMITAKGQVSGHPDDQFA
jgi:hypothetical protein